MTKLKSYEQLMNELWTNFEHVMNEVWTNIEAVWLSNEKSMNNSRLSCEQVMNKRITLRKTWTSQELFMSKSWKISCDQFMNKTWISNEQDIFRKRLYLTFFFDKISLEEILLDYTFFWANTLWNNFSWALLIIR